jgi:hypothetical protein
MNTHFVSSTAIHATLHRSDVAARAAAAILDNGGVTINRDGDTVAGFGYAVSPFKSRETVIPVVDFDATHVADFLSANADLLAHPAAALGGWFNTETNEVYLDVSIVVADLDVALRIGAASNQLAVCDLSTFESIPVARPVDCVEAAE